jgi:hypothetical protein
MSDYKYWQIERVGDGRAVRILLDRPDARNAQNRGIAFCGFEAAPTSGVRSIWAGLPRLLLASAERHDKAVSLSASCNRRTRSSRASSDIRVRAKADGCSLLEPSTKERCGSWA